MPTIINNNSFTLSPEVQQLIINAATSVGLDTVYISEYSFYEATGTFDVVADEESKDYLFSINANTSTVFDCRK